MNRLLSVSRCLIPAFATACLATGALAQPGPPPLGVTVLNTPLPVQVVNPPNTPAPTVSINPADISKGIGLNEATREIAQFVINVPFSGGAGDCNFTNLITVPIGKRLVITNVSAQAFLPSPAMLTNAALVNPQSTQFFVIVPVLQTFAVPGSNLIGAVAGQAMHIYSDTDLRACLASTSPSSNSGTVIVSGYYVTKP